jgi:tetratricopeptide (TPR) repeat protein
MDSRLMLLGYYKHQSTKEDAKHWTIYMLWMIENHPNDWITGHVNIHQKCSGKQFEVLRTAWLHQIDKEPNQGSMIGNAATFLSERDYDTSENLFKSAEKLQPKQSDWSRDLAFLYIQRARAVPPKYKPTYIALAFDQGKKVLRKDSHATRRFDMMMVLCDLALDNSEQSTALYFGKLLMASAHRMPWLLEFAHHRLGRIALRENDIAKAKAHLEEASRLGFSKNMSLPAELLRVGETECVLKYLERGFESERTNEMRTQLKKWIRLIKRGEIVSLLN